jgi:CheY-like chemotaxis protein
MTAPDVSSAQTVLLVDDNATVRQCVTRQTEKWGMVVRAAASAAEALQWLRQGENFDLALLDMQMPELDGAALAREMRHFPQTQSLPVVIMTGIGARIDATSSSAALTLYLNKPIKPAPLRSAFLQMLSGTKPASPKVVPADRMDPSLAKRLPLRVLLTDDNVINQKVASRLLQQMGYKADVANNGLEAIAALERQPYDLILMDVQMPELDGLEATRRIRQRQQQPSPPPHFEKPIFIIAMTANAMQGDRD